MKATPFLVAIISALTVSAFAEAPTPMTDLHKVLSAAAKDQKMAFILMGRPTCGNCNATKGMISSGQIPVTSQDFVMADLNCDDAKIQAEFTAKYKKENFGQTLPFVVVTDSHGKALASSGGMKSASEWNTILADAKSKAGAKAGPAAGSTAAAGGKDNWPFKGPATK